MDNTYNWDEKGFLMGFSQKVKRVMSKQEFQSGRIRANKQDSSREFLSLLAYICADGSAGPPTLIYKGQSKTLQGTWIENVIEGEEAYFTVSENGWSSYKVDLKFLESVFHKHTKDKANNRRRLLIVDGHSSHLNMAFINKCDELRIILAILPPHSTQRLQPLDVSLFQPLSTAYSLGIQKIMHDSEGMTTMRKRDFWKIFRSAWKDSFTKENIESGFARCGIWPWNPSMVLKIIEARPTTPLQNSSGEDALPLKTPRNACQLRQLKRVGGTGVDARAFKKLTKGLEEALAKLSIQEFRNGRLHEALAHKEKGNKRGKPLDLKGDEAGGASIWGVEEVLKAKEFQAQKEADTQQLVEEKAQKKEEAQERKERKEREQQEARIQRQLQVESKKEDQLSSSCKIIEKDITTTSTTTPKKAIKSRKAPIKTKSKAVSFESPKKNSIVVAIEDSQVVAIGTSRSGRLIRAPRHFDN